VCHRLDGEWHHAAAGQQQPAARWVGLVLVLLLEGSCNRWLCGVSRVGCCREYSVTLPQDSSAGSASPRWARLPAAFLSGGVVMFEYSPERVNLNSP
jgi:hypothetical protein